MGYIFADLVKMDFYGVKFFFHVSKFECVAYNIHEDTTHSTVLLFDTGGCSVK